MAGKKNRGSMIIEMTILMPVFLLCVVLYISAFLYYVDIARRTDMATQALYQKTEAGTAYDGTIQNYQQGGTDVVVVSVEHRYADIVVEMKKDAGNPVRNLRRWKTIADAVGERGDS